MNNLSVDTNLGDVELKWTEDGHGIIDDDAITAFECGHCHSFAYEMHDLTGWPIIGIGAGFVSTSPSHFMCYDPRIDDFVDIRGPKAMERNEEWIRGIVKVFEPNQFPSNYRPMNKTMAEPFVKTVLENLATLPTKHSKRKWNTWVQAS